MDAEGGGEQLSRDDRRQEILALLCEIRHETYANLEAEFGVCRTTIKKDIQALSCSYPIETIRGRHGGGVKLSDWFHMEKSTLSLEQIRVLKKTQRYFRGETDQALNTDDLKIIGSILLQFSPISHT